MFLRQDYKKLFVKVSDCSYLVINLSKTYNLWHIIISQGNIIKVLDEYFQCSLSKDCPQWTLDTANYIN